MSLLLALAVGFVLGLRHATDADHIAAVATMLRAERGLRGALRTGVLWGLGHSTTVLGAGAVVGSWGCAPPWSTRACELAVAAMLVLVGIASLRRRGARPTSPPSDARPVAVGLVHGLAGSAPLTLLALATVPTRAGDAVPRRVSARAPSRAWRCSRRRSRGPSRRRPRVGAELPRPAHGRRARERRDGRRGGPRGPQRARLSRALRAPRRGASHRSTCTVRCPTRVAARTAPT